MADITDPTVIAFHREKARVVADVLVGLKEVLPTMLDTYTTTIAPLIAGDADTDEIFDGAHADGRVINTKDDLVALMVLLNSLNGQIDTGTVFEKLNRVKVNARQPF